MELNIHEYKCHKLLSCFEILKKERDLLSVLSTKKILRIIQITDKK